jgi:hypothetical protein
MPEPDDKHEQLIEAAKTEIQQMAKEGFDHPSSKPVLIGAAIGTGLGIVVLHGAWILGLLAGAAVALYMQIRDRDPKGPDA